MSVNAVTGQTNLPVPSDIGILGTSAVPSNIGPVGVTGPNNISTATTTPITGVLKGASGNVAQAIMGLDYVGVQNQCARILGSTASSSPTVTVQFNATYIGTAIVNLPDVYGNTVVIGLSQDWTELIQLLSSGNSLLIAPVLIGLTRLADIDLSGNTLPSSEINIVLAQLVVNGVHSGTLNLSGQTPAAPPTGQGILDAATLTGLGWSVTTD